MKFSETSGGTEIAAAPTRDCAGAVVEKHCVRWGRENAGVRNVGKAPCLNEVRENCLKQLWGMEDDMATVVVLAVDTLCRRISECRVDFACLPDAD